MRAWESGRPAQRRRHPTCAPKGCSNRTTTVLTKRDREIVRWIGRHGAVQAEHVMTRFSIGRTAAYRRLHELVECELVRRHRLLYNHPGLLTATRTGCWSWPPCPQPPHRPPGDSDESRQRATRSLTADRPGRGRAAAPDGVHDLRSGPHRAAAAPADRASVALQPAGPGGTSRRKLPRTGQHSRLAADRIRPRCGARASAVEERTRGQDELLRSGSTGTRLGWLSE